MALIPPFMLDCVTAIGFPDTNGNPNFNSTGFLYGHPLARNAAGQMTYSTWLVTNRHVFDGESVALLRFNPIASTPAKVYPAPLKNQNGDLLWDKHPDPDVDLAVYSINYGLLDQEGIRCAFFSADQHLITHARASQAGVSEGDGIFVLGFPMGAVGRERNYVVVRGGVIARIRDSLAGAEKTFLVDAGVFPGNSGGPVITRPEAIAISGTQINPTAGLLGVVSSYLPYQDVAISAQTRRPRVIFEENSGLAIVIPVDRIAEVIEAAIQARTKPSSPSVVMPEPPATQSAGPTP
jgi:S1-C subfamily serine protease